MPAPGWLTTSPAAAGVECPSRASAPATTAWARGCSELDSTDAARASASSASASPTGTASSRAGRPWVRVPVLSSTTTPRRRTVSRVSPPRMSSPSSAPRPLDTITATGVARPRAQGQATTTVATAGIIAATSPWPVSAHAAKVAAASTRMAGTKTAETRSARRCTGGFSAWARSTSCTIWASTVSAPVRSTRIRSGTPPLTVPPISSAALALGDRHALPGEHRTRRPRREPWSTVPSVGIGSPGRTRRTSPAATLRVSTSVTRPGSSLSRRWATRG